MKDQVKPLENWCTNAEKSLTFASSDISPRRCSLKVLLPVAFPPQGVTILCRHCLRWECSLFCCVVFLTVVIRVCVCVCVCVCARARVRCA